MHWEYIGIAVVAVLWGCYPLMARWAGIGGPFGTLILTLSGLAPVTIAVLWRGVGERPSMTAIVRMAVAGFMMGIGLIAFNAVTNSRRIDASVSIPIMDTSMLFVTVVVAMFMFNEPMTTRKLFGLALLIAGIAVLRPES